MINLDPDTEVCVCNSKTAKEIAECIKRYDIKTADELFEKVECSLADKCESCRDEGYNNDGINIPLVLHLVKQGKL